MDSTNEQIRSFKELWLKKFNKELTNAEALEYSNNLLNLFRALLEVDRRVKQWDERLKNEPHGFSFPDSGSYNCNICYQTISDKTGWYDQFGIKCRVCQKAVNDGVVPGSIIADRKSWYSPGELKDKYGWSHPTLKKKIKLSELKVREIKSGESYWFYVFLKEENPNL